MIFYIKHRWYWALAATVAGALASWLLGAWDLFAESQVSLGLEICFGLGGGCLAIGINGVLHTLLRRLAGLPYRRAFYRHSWRVLGPMRWPEYVLGGVMAACAEEPLFRGVLLHAVGHPALGVALAALVFTLCHWFPRNAWIFWIWALWEGILFGWLMVWSGSLLVPMLAHGLHDLVAYRILQTMIRQPSS